MRCSYENQKNSKCLECKNKKYVLTKEGMCELCKIDNCVECHLDINTNEHICDKCDNNYYLDPRDGKCYSCYWHIFGAQKFDNLRCYFCPINVIPDPWAPSQNHDCYCSRGKTTKEPIVEPYKSLEDFNCPYGCSKCDYNDDDNLAECSECRSIDIFSSINIHALIVDLLANLVN